MDTGSLSRKERHLLFKYNRTARQLMLGSRYLMSKGYATERKIPGVTKPSWILEPTGKLWANYTEYLPMEKEEWLKLRQQQSQQQ
jgi:hypothetical protein